MFPIQTAGPEPFAVATTFMKSLVFKDSGWDFKRFDYDKDVAQASIEQTSSVQTAAVLSNDVNPDKLSMTIEALRANPDMTDEALAEYLSLKRPASARFWRLKAIEILNSPNRDTGPTAAVQSNWAVPTTIGATNGTSSKR